MEHYSTDQEISAMFIKEKRMSIPLEQLREEYPDASARVDDFLNSDAVTKLLGKTWDEYQQENLGKFQVIVRDESVAPISQGEGEPYIRYHIRDTHDEMGIRDFLGTRAKKIIMIGHTIPQPKE